MVERVVILIYIVSKFSLDSIPLGNYALLHGFSLKANQEAQFW